MAWKDILVFADGSENGLVRADLAADLPVALDADLEVCVPVCLPALSASVGIEFAVEVHDELELDARDDATRAAVEIRSRLPELAGRLAVGAPETRLPDLLVRGDTSHSQFRERVLGGVAHTAIRQSPISVLLSH